MFVVFPYAYLSGWAVRHPFSLQEVSLFTEVKNLFTDQWLSNSYFPVWKDYKNPKVQAPPQNYWQKNQKHKSSPGVLLKMLLLKGHSTRTWTLMRRADSSLTPDLINQNLPSNKLPRLFSCTLTVRSNTLDSNLQIDQFLNLYRRVTCGVYVNRFSASYPEAHSTKLEWGHTILKHLHFFPYHWGWIFYNVS